MHSLSAELQRLFGRPGQDLPDALPEAGFALDLVSADERVWTMVIGLAPAAGVRRGGLRSGTRAGQ